MSNNKILQLIFRASFMLFIPAIQIFYFILNNYRGSVRYIGNFIDDIIPFNRFFIVPYVYWYIYIFATLVFFLFFDYKNYFKLLTGIITGTLICFIVYYFFPTTVPRPEVLGSDFFSSMVRSIYYKDNPYNCFPSIHVLDTVIATAFLLRYCKKDWLKVFAFISCVSICLSTIFIKQHVIWDVISATLLGYGMFALYTSDYVWSRLPFKRVEKFLKIKFPARD